MDIKAGDRFINIKTGTIIEVESIYNKPDVYYIGTDDDIIRDLSRDRWYVTLVNITDKEKLRDMTLDIFERVLKNYGDIIKPYTESPIKPINFLKQHNIINHGNN